VLVAVELCSLTVQRDDATTANAIASGLFGDGAAAVLMAGDRHPLSRHAPYTVEGSRSVFFPNTERTMGWDVVETGFRVVLGPEVPRLARARIPPAVDDFLADHGLVRSSIARWIAHPGGPRVMDAMAEGLELEPTELDLARESLASVGNMSSASVLFVLKDTIERKPARPGEPAMLIAMGPGFCAELVLLRWGSP
jgi:alkylresorcinol/alkylpyrone synthase